MYLYHPISYIRKKNYVIIYLNMHTLEEIFFWKSSFSGSTLNFWSVKCRYVISP